MSPVHSNLSALRQLRGFTQIHVAAAIGVSRQTIHNIEHDYKIPSLEIALKLSRYFDVTVEKLFVLGSDTKTNNRMSKPKK